VLVLCTAINGSGPLIEASLTWNDNVATVATATNHNVPIGASVNARISQSDSSFDGLQTMLATSPATLTYALMTNPNEAVPIGGVFDQPLDLTGNFVEGLLLFHAETQQFEYV